MSKVFKAFIQNERAIRKYIARYCSHPQDIEDFTQETFLKGFAAEMKGEVREPKAFLFTIARNVALYDIRKKTRTPMNFTEIYSEPELIIDESKVGADDWLNSRRKLVFFAKAVATLPPQCQKAFLLRRVDGLHYKQIANRMDISVSAVEKHVVLGLLKCKAYLKAHGYDASELGCKQSKALPPKSGNDITVENDA